MSTGQPTGEKHHEPQPLSHPRISDRKCLGFVDSGRIESHTFCRPSPHRTGYRLCLAQLKGKKMNKTEMFVLYSKQTAKNKYTGHRSSQGDQLLPRGAGLLSCPERLRDLTLQSKSAKSQECKHLSTQTPRQWGAARPGVTRMLSLSLAPFVPKSLGVDE